MPQEQEFIKARKPKGFSGYHFAVMFCLMHETPPIRLSQPSIGERTGISKDKVIDVLKDLRAWKWIHSYSGRRKYNTNSIEILYANLPQPEPIAPLVISDHAIKLAEGFKRIWVERCSKYRNKRGWNCTRPLRKDWKKRWEPVFQRLLNEGYEFNEVADILNAYTGTNKDPKLLIAGPQNRKLFPAKKVQCTESPTNGGLGSLEPQDMAVDEELVAKEK